MFREFSYKHYFVSYLKILNAILDSTNHTKQVEESGLYQTTNVDEANAKCADVFERVAIEDRNCFMSLSEAYFLKKEMGLL